MKLHINQEQLNELSDKGKERLREWWENSDLYPELDDDFVHLYIPEGNMYPLLSIGQMIEFLDEYSKKDWKIDTNFHDDLINCKDHLGLHEYEVRWANDKGQIGFVSESNILSDALWKAVKEVLEG
jgi:hypothetical protein